MCGLIFTDDHVQKARKNKKRQPHQAGWEMLLGASQAGNPLQQVQWDGWRYRFNADLAAGEQGISTLINLPVPTNTPDLLIALQLHDLLYDHPAYKGDWLQRCITQFDSLPQADDIVEKLWQSVVQTAIGVLTQDEARLQDGISVFHWAIDEAIHPEGYLTEAVKVGPEATALERQIKSVQALCLIAEMVKSTNLWKYNNRGVSITTAATYPLYYFFYPEKWKWNGEEWKPSNGVTEADAKQIFKSHAGFLELVRHHYDPPLKAIQMILDELRPVYDPFCGGLLTLSHADAKKWSLFG